MVHLDTSNAVDSIIIIVAMTGLLVGICTSEEQISNLARPDAENSEGGKSEGE